MIVTITPTQRLAASMQQKNGALVLSWNAWLNELWLKLSSWDPDLPIRFSAWQSQRLWRCIIEADQHTALLNTTATTKLAWEAWQHMHRWLLPLDYCTTPSEDVAVFLKWAHQYQQQCQHQRAVDEVTFLNVLIQKKKALMPILPTQLQCVGFDDWPPQWQQWLDVLALQGVEVSHQEESTRLNNKTCVAYALTDEETEWQAAALWVRTLVEAEVKAPIAVVIPNLAQARARILNIFNACLNPWAGFRVGEKQIKRFNISGGTPLSQAPPIEVALAVMRWILDPLQVPLVSFLSTTAYLKTMPNISPTWSDHQYTVSEWILKLLQFLEGLGWPGERIVHSDGYQAIVAWHGVLKTLKKETYFLRSLSYFDFYRAVSDLCVQTLFQTQSVHECSNIHVLGILEAAGLDFEYIWIAGLYEGQWPQPSDPNPFIDFAIQRQQNMPHASSERETAFAQKILKRLVGQSRQVVLSAPLYQDLKPVLESQLIFEHTATINPLSPTDTKPSALKTLQGLIAYESYTDQEGVSWSAEQLYGGVSVLKTQAACPFKAYAQYRLGVKPPVKMVYGLSAQERGKWLHKALELFWIQVQSQQKLQNMATSEYHTRIQQVVREARLLVMQKSVETPIRGIQFWQIESLRMESLMNAVCAWEKTRDSFKVCATEQERPVLIEGLPFKMRLDRIDAMEGGGYWIIDYKTGKQKISDWLNDRLSEPQLPIYALNASGSQSVTGIMAVEIHPKKVQVHLLEEKTVESSVGISWNTLQAQWATKIYQLAKGFKQGMATVDPIHPTLTCQYCHCQSFCRRFEGVEYER